MSGGAGEAAQLKYRLGRRVAHCEGADRKLSGDARGGSCRALISSHNSKPFPRYACPRLRTTKGPHPLQDTLSYTLGC